MLGSRPILPLALLWVAASLLAVVAGSGEAPAQTATARKIEAERDKLTERVSRFALTLPKSDPDAGQICHDGIDYQVRRRGPGPACACGADDPVHLFAEGKARQGDRDPVLFDDGAVRDYKLKIIGRNGAHAMLLPKFGNEDPVADVVAAKRLRVEIDLPSAGATLLDFNVIGAADAVKAIACQ